MKMNLIQAYTLSFHRIRQCLSLGLLAALATLNSSALALPKTWTTGNGGDGLWSNTANWGGAIPAVNDTLIFGNTAGTTTLTHDLPNTYLWSSGASVINATNFRTFGITFNSDAPAYTINGTGSGSTTLTVDGTITVNSASGITQTINSNLSSATNGGITVAGAGDLTLGGGYSRLGTWNPGFTMNGSGVLTLSKTGFFATGGSGGAFTFNSGTVKLNSGFTGFGLGGGLTINGGTLDLMGATIGTIVRGSSGQIVNNGGATSTLTLGTANTFISYGGTIKDGTSAIALRVASTASNTYFQVLSGNNAYTGGTTITSTVTAGSVGISTLSIASMDNIGASGSRNLTFGGSATGTGAAATVERYLQITGTGVTNSNAFDSITFTSGRGSGFDIADSTNTFTLSNAVDSGTGAFFKRGAGTLVMTANNTYTAATTIQGGTLKVDYTAGGSLNSASAPSLNGGGTLLLVGKSGVNTTTQTLGNLSAQSRGGGSILIDPNNGTSTTLNLGTLTVSGAGNALLVGKAVTANTGTVTITTTTNKSADGTYGGRVIFADGTANTGYDFATTASGSSPYTLSAYTAATTLPTSVGNSTTNYKMTAGTTLSGNVSVNTLKLEAPSGDLDLGTNNLTVTSGGLLSTGTSAVQITGSGAVGLMPSGTGDLIIHQYNSGGLTIGAVIGNGVASTLTKTGTGTLVLTAANNYSGSTYINGGKLSISAINNMGTAAETVFLNGGTLLWTGGTSSTARAFSVGGGGGGIEVASGGVLQFNGANAATGEFTKSGLGTLTLGGAGTFNGGVRIEDGTLKLGVANSLSSANGATSALVFGSGSTAKLQLNNFDAAVASLVSSNANAIVENGSGSAGTKTLTVSNGADNTFAGTLRNGSTGALAVTKTGGGTLTLTNTNTYTGTTTVSGGSLQVGSSGAGTTGTGAVTVQTGATILGTGNVRGSTFTADSGSILRPGDSVADSSHGTLTFTPSTASGSTSSLQGSIILGISGATTTNATFGGNTIGSAGYNAWVDAVSGTGSHDRLSFSNPTAGTGYNLNFLTTTGSLQVIGSSFTPAQGQVFNLLDWGTSVTTNFSGFTFHSGYLIGNGDEGTDLDLPDLTSSGLLWDFSRFIASGNIVIVPEPSRALLLLLGLASLMARRRRQ